MSYKIVIADDEEIIRDGLNELITEECSEIEILGLFNDGKGVIDLLKKQSADLVITDIRMPLVDGLEVAKYIYENKLDTKVIIITAYRNFDYACDALIYGVYRIEPKPIDLDSIVGMVNSLKEQKQNDAALKQERKAANDFIERRDFIAKQLYAFVSGNLEYDDIKRLLAKDYDDPSSLRCALIHFKTAGENHIEYSRDNWRYMCEMSLDNIDAYCIHENESSALVLLLTPDESVEGKADLYADDIKKLIKKAYKTDVTYGVETFDNLIGFVIKNTRNAVELYTDYLINGNLRAMEDLTETLKSAYSFDWIKNFTYSVINHFNLALEIDTSYYFNRIKYAQKKEDFFDLLNDISKNVATNSKSRIFKVKHYVNKHYKEDISLVTVAAAFGLNPTYLSRIFKKEAGESFADYCQRFKINIAKEMLMRGNLSVKEIAEALGYSSVGYFDRVFKSETGYTPKQFRNAGIGNG